ncbi:CRYB [Mytilus coruscus]|uniref:CRYB n=1 Tax=Mytilus coruscus TaxID=42192 RepID=A0A6J8EUR5_MYTCO|nr:CRYB [Mytilus coruscus]
MDQHKHLLSLLLNQAVNDMSINITSSAQKAIIDAVKVKLSKTHITLYKNKKFGGRSKEFTKSCPDLLDAGFDDITSSVKCERGVWILYQFKNYKGRIFVIEEGEVYDKFSKYFQDRSSSLKLLDGYDFTEEPECTVYADIFSGRSLTFTDDVENLKWYKFDNKISSIEVKSGAWVGYQHPNYGGDQTLFLKGKYEASDKPCKPNDEGGFKNDRISSFSQIFLKPAAGDKMKLLQIDYDLDKAHILRTPTSVFSWTQVNNTSVEQTVTKTDEITITREDTYEFRWDRAAKVSTTMTGKVGIPLVGETDVSISSEMSVSMGKTAGTKKSKTDKWVAEYPSKIPRYSTVTVTSKLTQGNINIPFTAILYYGDDTERTITEKETLGIYSACSGVDRKVCMGELLKGKFVFCVCQIILQHAIVICVTFSSRHRDLRSWIWSQSGKPDISVIVI